MRGDRDMAEIAEALRVALSKTATGHLGQRIERELAAHDLYDVAEEERPEPERCGGCGGLKSERDHESNSDRMCRCDGRKERLLLYLDATDPEQRMTLDALDVSEPTLATALEKTRLIISGERRRGMLLMGLPGRGKTHLMVGLGRALLERDHNAGYYNVARLVSRIQETYGNCGEVGESRRRIIESVASHEVVLLDDFGKEHTSTNVESIVYELFDALHAARTILVVSTNVPASRAEGYWGPTLSERYGEAVRSRLRAMCERFVVGGEDRRRGNGERVEP